MPTICRPLFQFLKTFISSTFKFSGNKWRKLIVWRRNQKSHIWRQQLLRREHKMEGNDKPEITSFIFRPLNWDFYSLFKKKNRLNLMLHAFFLLYPSSLVFSVSNFFVVFAMADLWDTSSFFCISVLFVAFPFYHSREIKQYCWHPNIFILPFFSFSLLFLFCIQFHKLI